jgi:alkanesulfonate monooxygenase SsuD/methylene tetrahydromethanopterin reductase-like flavin-dependent oxidoreductase (luciferase family)
MRFGFFDQLPCAPGYSEPQRYKDIIAQIELGDAIGFDTAWLGEIHFIREFSILADPLMVLAAAAQRTSRIRLGTAVTLLPLHSPIKIAEEAAIADILRVSGAQRKHAQALRLDIIAGASPAWPTVNLP